MRGASRLRSGWAAGAPALTLAIICAVAGAGCTGEAEVDTLPEVTLERFEAPGEVDLASVRGPAVVNLWASWCGPCRDELPIAQEFYERHGDEVTLLGIDYQDPQVDRARELAQQTGLTYEQLADLDGQLDAAPPFPALRGLPFWAFVDAQGRVVHREFVEVESVAQLSAMVSEHLGLDL